MMSVSPLMWPSVSTAAREILTKLPRTNWHLSERDFKILVNYCLHLQEKNLVLKLSYYFQLQAGLHNTTNDSPKHGCYLALIQQFKEKYPAAIHPAITSNSTTHPYVPCA